MGRIVGRKNLQTWIGTFVIGGATALMTQYNVDPETMKWAIAAMAALFGVNINGIAMEDAAKKGNEN